MIAVFVRSDVKICALSEPLFKRDFIESFRELLSAEIDAEMDDS